MATIVVRNVPDEVKARLVERAHRHKRSMEAEVRCILAETLEPATSWVETFFQGADRIRAEFGGIDLELPERTDMGREPIDFS